MNEIRKATTRLSDNPVLRAISDRNRQIGRMYRHAINQIEKSGIRDYSVGFDKDNLWENIKVKGFTYAPTVEEDEHDDDALEFKMIFVGHSYEELSLQEFIERFEDEEVKA